MVALKQVEYITGKPMRKIQGIEMDPVYRAAYRACINAGKNRTKATAREYGKIAEIGLDNPAKTKLVMRTAQRDYMNDIAALAGENFDQVLIRKVNTIKTNIQLSLNATFRKSQKMINKALKEQHPESHKLRNKVLKRKEAALVNETTPFARLGRLNINPLNL